MEKNWLENSLKYFKDESIAGVTGPILTPSEQNSFAKAVAFIFSLSVFVAKSTHKETQNSVQGVEDFPTCNAIYRKEALSKVMPLDENLFSGSDVELNYRLRQLGYKLLSTPDVKVWHYKRETPRGFWRQMYRYAIGRLQIGKKWPKLLNIAHIAVGLSIPLLIIILTLSLVAYPVLFFFLLGLVLVLLLLVCMFAFFKTSLLSITICLPMVIAILVTAWSIGFCREMIFPMRGPQAN
jgi:GT2 family glycosyltransferase